MSKSLVSGRLTCHNNRLISLNVTVVQSKVYPKIDSCVPLYSNTVFKGEDYQ
jgi:hypothetical protein